MTATLQKSSSMSGSNRAAWYKDYYKETVRVGQKSNHIFVDNDTEDDVFSSPTAAYNTADQFIFNVNEPEADVPQTINQNGGKTLPSDEDSNKNLVEKEDKAELEAEDKTHLKRYGRSFSLVLQNEAKNASTPYIIRSATKQQGTPENVPRITGIFSNKCRKCDGRVYEMEKILADHSAYHKSCFRCTKCQQLLNSQSYVMMDGLPYCNLHKDLLQNKSPSLAGETLRSQPPPINQTNKRMVRSASVPSYAELSALTPKTNPKKCAKQNKISNPQKLGHLSALDSVAEAEENDNETTDQTDVATDGSGDDISEAFKKFQKMESETQQSSPHGNGSVSNASKFLLNEDKTKSDDRGKFDLDYRNFSIETETENFFNETHRQAQKEENCVTLRLSENIKYEKLQTNTEPNFGTYASHTGLSYEQNNNVPTFTNREASNASLSINFQHKYDEVTGTDFINQSDAEKLLNLSVNNEKDTHANGKDTHVAENLIDRKNVSEVQLVTEKDKGYLAEHVRKDNDEDVDEERISIASAFAKFKELDRVQDNATKSLTIKQNNSLSGSAKSTTHPVRNGKIHNNADDLHRTRTIATTVDLSKNLDYAEGKYEVIYSNSTNDITTNEKKETVFINATVSDQISEDEKQVNARLAICDIEEEKLADDLQFAAILKNTNKRDSPEIVTTNCTQRDIIPEDLVNASTPAEYISQNNDIVTVNKTSSIVMITLNQKSSDTRAISNLPDSTNNDLHFTPFQILEESYSEGECHNNDQPNLHRNHLETAIEESDAYEKELVALENRQNLEHQPLEKYDQEKQNSQEIQSPHVPTFPSKTLQSFTEETSKPKSSYRIDFTRRQLSKFQEMEARAQAEKQSTSTNSRKTYRWTVREVPKLHRVAQPSHFTDPPLTHHNPAAPTSASWNPGLYSSPSLNHPLTGDMESALNGHGSVEDISSPPPLPTTPVPSLFGTLGQREVGYNISKETSQQDVSSESLNYF